MKLMLLASETPNWEQIGFTECSLEDADALFNPGANSG